MKQAAPSDATARVAGCALGIDVGGTKIAGGVVTFPEGRVIVRKTFPTDPGRGGAAVLDDVLNLAQHLHRAITGRGQVPTALGIGLAELVDRQGNVASAATIAWQDLPVRERLSSLLPAWLEADVRAAARAEAGFGAGRPYRHFVYVTVGTGISSCLVVDGLPYSGARGLAGTFASNPVLFADASGQLRDGPALEAFASGPALATRLRAVDPAFAGAAPEVYARADAGDAAARAIVESAGRCLGAAIGQLINVLDPEAVILGGGLGLAKGRFQAALEAEMRQRCWSPLHATVPLLSAQTGLDAGIIGSAYGALTNLNQT